MNSLGEAEKLAAIQRLLKEAKTGEAKFVALSALHDSDLSGALPLLKEIAAGSGGADFREGAIEAIGESKDPKALAALKEIFGLVKENELKSRVLSAIAQKGGSEALTILSEAALTGTDERLAEDAVHAISEVENEPDAERYALLNILRKSKSGRVKEAAISSLLEKPTAENIKAIGQYLTTETNPDLRQAVCDSLGETENDEAVPILLEIAKTDKDIETRRAATRALGEIASPKAQNALVELLKKKDGTGKG
jgi:HEAT repeat protein